MHFVLAAGRHRQRARLMVALLAAFALTFASSAAFAADVPGTPGNDNLTGTTGDDNIHSEGGNDNVG